MLEAPLNLTEEVLLEPQVGDGRRIDVEVGATVIEVKKDQSGPVFLSEGVTVKELSEKTGILAKDLVKAFLGRGILAALALGADFAYIGTRFIATREARASDAYKACLVDSTAADIVYTPYFSGVAGNYLRASIVAAGFDPEHLPSAESPPLDLAAATTAKVWKDIWGAGQGVGAIDDLPPTADLVARLAREYAAARVALNRLSP